MRALGRTPSRRDRRTLRLADYLASGVLHAAPPRRDWSSPVHRWGTFQNLSIGDCTCAAIAHALQAAAAHTGRPLALTDADVVAAYSAISGYDPALPETDRGAMMLDALRHVQKVGLGGVQIEAYVSVEPLSRAQIETAVNLTGSAYIGLDLPLAWQTSTTWDVAPTSGYDANWRPNSWGGHAVSVVEYDRLGLLVVTWGGLKAISWEALWTYCSEAWCYFEPLWLRTDGLTPSGFDLGALRSDLANIRSAA